MSSHISSLRATKWAQLRWNSSTTREVRHLKTGTRSLSSFKNDMTCHTQWSYYGSLSLSKQVMALRITWHFLMLWSRAHLLLRPRKTLSTSSPLYLKQRLPRSLMRRLESGVFINWMGKMKISGSSFLVCLAFFVSSLCVSLGSNAYFSIFHSIIFCVHLGTDRVPLCLLDRFQALT